MRRTLVLLTASVLIIAACGTATEDAGSTNPGDQLNAVGVLFEPSSNVRAAADPTAPVTALAAGFNNAGFNLLRTQSADENLVLSPTSIGHALLMARAAADAATGAAIDTAFGLPQGLAAHQAWNTAAHAIAASVAAQDEMTVTIADRIWPRRDVTPQQDWIDLLAAQHGTAVEALDYAGDPAGSRDIINSWISAQTSGLIPELLPAGFLDATTVLVLTNAMYLAARWQTPFGKYPSETATFTRLDGSTTQIEFMRELELTDRRGLGDGFTAAEIPYAGGDLSMMIIVPEEGRFTEVRDRLDQSLLDEIDAGFATGPYELLLPRWSTTSAVDLIPWLTERGAAPGAYPSITPDAFLDDAVHGASITVDEWGTVAAAATALGFEASGAPEPELTVAADHPFLYVIRHRPTGLVLLAGQVTDPTV